MFRALKLAGLLPALLFIPESVLAQTGNDEREGRVPRLIVPAYALPAATVARPLRSNVFQRSQPRDSLKNGAIIGAVSGALVGACLAVFVCKLGEEFEGETPDDFSCPGPAAILVGGSTVIGAAIGVGVDALLERGPSAALPAGGTRTVIRVRLAF